jgi:hypothetical protein
MVGPSEDPALSTGLFQNVHTYLLIAVGNKQNLVSEILRAKFLKYGTCMFSGFFSVHTVP